MPPNILSTSTAFVAEGTTTEEPASAKSLQRAASGKRLIQTTLKHNKHKQPLVWRSIIFFIYLHIAALYGLYIGFIYSKWSSFLFTFAVGYYSSQGITAGAHRLWTHRSYKANLPLRIILMIAQTVSLQKDIYDWVRDHRVHHKFTETDADPHNATRGFFFAHMGWLMVKKHEDVTIKGKTIDMSDLEADPVVMFQRKYYMLLMPLCCFVIPMFVPWYCFGEDFSTCWHGTLARIAVSWHITWLVNSAAHMWGTKPYDKTIAPSDNVYVAFWAVGEGWHNYHHVFPWDYKAAELGFYRLNFTTMVIDFFYKIGWAHDLKTTSIDMIKKRVSRTGDGTRKFDEENENESGYTQNDSFMHEGIWGWGDKDMKPEEIQQVTIYGKSKDM